MIEQRINNSLWLVGLLLYSVTGMAAFETAADAVQASDFDTARKHLEAVPQEERENPQWQLLQAATEAGSGEPDKAEQRYLALIEREPGLPEAYNNLAAIYAQQGRLDEAMELLEKAMKTNQSYATIYANLRSIYYEMSRSAYAKALQMEQRKSGPALEPILLVAAEPQAQQAVSEEEPVQVAMNTAVEPVVETKAQPVPVVSDISPTEPPEAVNVALAAVDGVAGQSLNAPEMDGLRRDEVIAMLNSWAADWSGQKVEAYLEAYAEDFRPGHGLNLQQWQAQRRKRLSRPGAIEVHLGDFDVQFSGDDRASVTVVQYYRSERYSDTVRKRFKLVHVTDGWKIVSEKTLEVL